jgi:glycosyltransferase involved in cell wall biosynthesis
MSKKRILFATESSWLSTGFSTYGREVITRAAATEQFEIAEMGNYGRSNDPRALDLPWKFYGTLPNNPREEEIFKSNRVNEFGGYKIEAVLADFQPDIVISHLDPWMTTHLQNNRWRSNYKLVLIPTVDSAPQKTEWVEGLFKKADALFTYSRFGKRTLEQQNGLKVIDVASPGVDLSVFKPMARDEIRSKWCVKPNLLVFGTVMRNQRRKLFPDLFEAYAELRRKYGKRKEIEHSVLLCHTSWPDVGWDIPELLQRNNIQRHVIFTYKCANCTETFFSWFIPCDEKGMARCVVCGNQTAHMPNTHNGVSDKDLAEIFNIMDIYIQPAICEGWGMPIVEAKACGVPGLYQNYSAMEDHVENGGGLAIKVDRLYTEPETMALRSLPDIKDMVEKMYKLATDKQLRSKLGLEARSVAETKHNWQSTADKLINEFSVIEILDRATTWDKPANIAPTNPNPVPRNLSNEDFIVYCYTNILGRQPDQKGFNDWMKSLMSGATRESVENYFRGEINTLNQFESVRFSNSMRIRGIEPIQINQRNNVIPGIVV